MARPPSNRRLLVEDFPADQQEWIGDLLQVLNQFMDQTTSALTNNLTISENGRSQIKVLTFNGNATFLGTLTSGSASMTNVSSTVSLTTGMLITAPGIPAGTTISVIAGTTITMSNMATANYTGATIVAGTNFPINFQYLLPTKPISLRIGQIFENVDNPETMVNPVTLDWEFLNGQIIINHITGLKANTNYQAIFIVEGS